MYQSLLQPIHQFLQCETPDAWIAEARRPERQSLILIDHMICELKAAQTAMWLIRKYALDRQSGELILQWLKPYEDYIYRHQGSLNDLAHCNVLSKKLIPDGDTPFKRNLVDKMVVLIKEELHHFYQVLELMHARQIAYENIPAGRYAKGLMKHVTTHEPDTLIDKLICGAYIEARSCERFARLAPYVDETLQRFYLSLLRSEARHYQDYLHLAEEVADRDISERVRYFGEVEAELIRSTDSEFRFHSGVPLLS